jgi:putative drug exporter of the RND superfamily
VGWRDRCGHAIEPSAGATYSDNFSLPQTESHRANRLLALSAPRLSGDTEEVVIALDSGRVTDPAARAALRTLLGRLSRLPHVTAIQSPDTPGGARRAGRASRVC